MQEEKQRQGQKRRRKPEPSPNEAESLSSIDLVGWANRPYNGLICSQGRMQYATTTG